MVLLKRTQADGSAVDVRCKTTGSRIAWFTGGFFDSQVPYQAYLAALAAFFEEHLSRDSTERLTFMIDTR